MCPAPPEQNAETVVTPAMGFENAKRGREVALAPSLAERQREIALAAIAIADESGIDAVSMRNIAERLGMGTMTIYSYVENKEDLVALMADELTAEFLIPEPVPAEWREAVRQVAMNSHMTIERHPWMLSAPGQEFDLRPNVMLHVDQSIRAVAGIKNLEPLERMQIMRIVDDYVVGHAQRATRRLVRSDPKQEERKVSERLRTAKQTEIKRMFDDGELPALSALFGGDAEQAMERIAQGPPPNPQSFEIGLEIVLDGVAAMIERSGR